MQKININPPPTYPKPPAPPAPPKVDNGCKGMSNAEVYGALALILSELQKINERLDDVINDCEAELDYRPIDFSLGEVKVPFDEHLPDLMYREDKNFGL